MVLKQGFRVPKLKRPWLAVSAVVLVLVDILVALLSAANIAVWASALVYLSLLIVSAFGSEFGWLPIVSCCLIMWVASEPQLAYSPYACLLVLGMWVVERKYLSLLVGITLFDISVIGNSSNFEMSAISMIVINVVMVAAAWAIGRWQGYSLELERRLRLLEVAHRQARIAAQQRAAERLHASVAKDISHALISMRILKLESRSLAEKSQLAACEQILSRAAKDLRGFMVAMADDTGAALAALEGDVPASSVEPLLTLLRSAKIKANVEIDRLYAAANQLPPWVWRVCWQLLDEGVVNICKYGKQGGAARVFAAVVQEEVVIELTNDVNVVPRKGDAVSSTGMGLQAMKRQVEHIGGTCDWERRPGKWTLRARIPAGFSSEAQS